MEFFKNIFYPKRTLHFLLFIGIFLPINNFRALASEDELYLNKNQKTYNFDQVYFQNSISYREYDSLDGQLKSFFGLKSDLSNTNYYPDLNIISDSDAVRHIYKSKLNDMIIDDFNYEK